MNDSLPKFEWVQIRASDVGEVERYDHVLCDIDPHRLLLRIQRRKRFYVIDLTEWMGKKQN